MMNYFFFQAEDGIRDGHVTGVQTCALPILNPATTNIFSRSLIITNSPSLKILEIVSISFTVRVVKRPTELRSKYFILKFSIRLNKSLRISRITFWPNQLA